MKENDELVLMEDDAEETDGPPWQVLVVDDDADVHAATGMVLGRLRHNGRPMAMSSAHSGRQAMEQIRDSENPFDLVLLDVVMDTPTDGLDTARSIREFLECSGVPYIIIRTGQPAYAAETDVLSMPEVNAYLTKGKVTAAALTEAIIKGLDSAHAFSRGCGSDACKRNRHQS